MAEQFRQVGEFIDFSKRPLIKSPKNPIDKSTIVSIYPKDINEVKHTIEPGKFHIPAGSYEDPAILVVGTSSWWRDIDVEQPMIEIPVSSIQIADSIIKDYCNGLLGCNMSDAMPGMFFIPGEATVFEIKAKYKERLAEAKHKQNNWYRILVALADSLWARSNGNPIVISNEMKMGAESLGLRDKDWLKDHQAVDLVKCSACGNNRDPRYPVCPACKAIDREHPLAKDLKFAV